MTGTVTSPSLASQLTGLQQQFPAMRWHQWEPLHRDNELAPPSRLSAGRSNRVFDVGAADVIFAVGSDLISAAPGWLAYARAFAARRRPAETGGKMSRVYAIESTPTLLGAKADHRLPMRPDEIAASLRFLAGAVGAGPQEWSQQENPHAAWLKAAAEDLNATQGRAPSFMQGASSRSKFICWRRINNALGGFGKTVRLIAPVMASTDVEAGRSPNCRRHGGGQGRHARSCSETNPVYTAPADLEFAAALRRVPFSACLALMPTRRRSPAPGKCRRRTNTRRGAMPAPSTAR